MAAKPAEVERLKKALQALIEPSRNELGCLVYELWQETPTSFIMYERFESESAFEQHLKRPYIQSFFENEYQTYVASHWAINLHPAEL